jgi:hypothetical protein
VLDRHSEFAICSRYLAAWHCACSPHVHIWSCMYGCGCDLNMLSECSMPCISYPSWDNDHQIYVKAIESDKKLIPHINLRHVTEYGFYTASAL